MALCRCIGSLTLTYEVYESVLSLARGRLDLIAVRHGEFDWLMSCMQVRFPEQESCDEQYGAK